MEVHIEEIVSNVTTLDDKALLSPPVMASIVRAVLEAVEEREARRMRWADERSSLGSPGHRGRTA